MRGQDVGEKGDGVFGAVLADAGTPITQILVGLGSLSGVAALVGVYLSRRSAREANQTQDELSEFTILRGTVEALHAEVKRLQESLDDANNSLSEANEKAEHLNRELLAAQHNVLILSNHIREYVPEIPFPELRRMNVSRFRQQ